MNPRGQAFSVFQLLIAAVVAGAILVILFQVLNTINPVGQNDPGEIAGSAVETQVTNTGTPAFRQVTFSRDSSLSSRGIAAQTTSLSASRICVGVSESVPNYESFIIGGRGESLFYTGGNQQARLMVFCDRGDEIEVSLSSFRDSFGFDLGTPDCPSEFTQSSSRSCFVIVVPGV